MLLHPDTSLMCRESGTDVCVTLRLKLRYVGVVVFLNEIECVFVLDSFNLFVSLILFRRVVRSELIAFNFRE